MTHTKYRLDNNRYRQVEVPRGKRAQIGLALAIIIGVIVVLGIVKFLQIRSAMQMAARMGPGPEAVTTTKVEQASWRQRFDTVGSFLAVEGVTISAEEPGTVSRIGFESGSKVQAGQVLLELDHSVEDANLAGALSRAELARRNLARSQSLKSQSALSLATLEDAQSKLQQAEAEVKSLRALIQRKTIKAPFIGSAGIRMINVGEYVAAGRAIVPLQSLNPLFFNFSVPQQILPNLKLGSPVEVRVDTFPNDLFQGRVTAINPNVNEATRNIEIQATFSNSDEKILPGMYGRALLDLGSDSSVLVIPSSSVVYAPYGDFVYVVERKVDDAGNEMTSVRHQKVELGVRKGDMVSVVGGLSQGEEIVTSGGFKLRPGAKILVNNQVTIPHSDNPQVQDS